MKTNGSPAEKYKRGLSVLSEQKKKEEIYPPDPDGESSAKLELIKELQSMGYSYSYFSDIELSPVRSREVMRILLSYFPRMESYYTKQTILTKIDPRVFPEVFGLALDLYLQYSPYERLAVTGLQTVLSRSEMTKENVEILYGLIKDPDGYASGPVIRNKLCKTIPDKMRGLSYTYKDGILLIDALDDFCCYKDEESRRIIESCVNIPDELVNSLKVSNGYALCVSLYEYYLRFFNGDTVRKKAGKLFRKISK